MPAAGEGAAGREMGRSTTTKVVEKYRKGILLVLKPDFTSLKTLLMRYMWELLVSMLQPYSERRPVLTFLVPFIVKAGIRLINSLSSGMCEGIFNIVIFRCI